MPEHTEPAVTDWSPDREWEPNDPRWKEPPQYSGEKFLSKLDRGACPYIPQGDYVLLGADSLPFVGSGGLVIETSVDSVNTDGPHAVVLTIIAVGPDVKDYLPGNLVFTSPRNAELVVAWRDPRPDSSEEKFLVMQSKMIMGRYDADVIHQMKLRYEYWEAVHAKRKAEQALKKAEEDRIRNSDLNPFKPKEVLDATGQPASRSGYQDLP